jgi:hypothetical protein
VGDTSIADSGTTRRIYISTDISRIPHLADVVAGRINGQDRVPAADWQLFPHSALVAVDALGTSPGAADVLDLYSGNATLADLGAWWDTHVATRSLKPGVRVAAEDAAQVHRLLPPQHCALWVVAYGEASTFPGATVVENTVLAVTAGAQVTSGIVLDPEWMPTPPKGRTARAVYDVEHAHMARMRAGLPLQSSGPSRGPDPMKG